VAGYEINTQNSITFLHTKNECMNIKTENAIPFIIGQKLNM
jgi:hypothetical protein